MKPGGNCLPVHQGLACIQGQWTHKLLSVGAPGEVNAVALQLTFGVPLCTHPGIVFKLTAIPTDTGSILPCTVANRSGISPSHNSIPKRFSQQGTMHQSSNGYLPGRLIMQLYHLFILNDIVQIVAPSLDAKF